MTQRLLAVVLGAGSALHWLLFFAWGRFDMTVADWPRQSAYFKVLRDALAQLRLPLETTQPIFDMGRGFVANLEAPLAPHVWLFALGGDRFAVAASAVLMSCVGVYGCLRLARRLGLGALAFVLLTLLLCFNGAIVAHVAAGHLGWLGCYLLPFVAEAMIVIDGGGRKAARAASMLALVLFALLVLGSLHIALICCGFIALSILTVPRMRAPLALCFAQFALLSAFRLLPAASMFWRGGRQWIAGGYQPLQMLEALLLVRAPGTPVDVPATLALGIRDSIAMTWVEFDAYVGAIGVLLLVVFAIVAGVRPLGAASPHERAIRALQLPCLLLAGLSLWHFYAALVVAPISVLSVERVPSRFFGVAVSLALVVAIARFDTWWRAHPRDTVATMLAWAAAGMAAAQLAYHSLIYSPARGPLFDVRLPAIEPVLASASSGAYLAALIAGALITASGLVWTLTAARSTS